MTKLSRAQLQRIVDRDAPGWQLVKKSTGTPPVRTVPDAVSPELDEIRRQYGLPESSSTPISTQRPAVAVTASTGKTRQPEDRIVLLEPKTSAGVAGRGPGPKAVVVSEREGRIIGRQG